MRAGKLRSYVTVQQRSTQRTGAGDVANVWTDVFSAYAHIYGLPGYNREEILAAGAVRNVGTYRFTMRYDARLTSPAMRIKYGTRTFNITTPPKNTDDLNAEMIFEAQEFLTDV